MQSLVEDFLQHLRHERGQAEHTQRTYAALLNKFVVWAGEQGVSDWKSVGLRHLMSFLEHERKRALANQPKESTRRLSSESLYLEIAALRAFYRFAEGEKLLPANVAENLSLPRRWQRVPKALSSQEIDKLLTPETPETPQNLCDQAVLELAYASGLRLAELRGVRLEQLHLDAGFINVIGKGNKERVVPLGSQAVTAWTLNRTGTSATLSGAAWATGPAKAASSRPLSVMGARTSFWPPSANISMASALRAESGESPTLVQKQDSSARVQASGTTVQAWRRVL